MTDTERPDYSHPGIRPMGHDEAVKILHDIPRAPSRADQAEHAEQVRQDKLHGHPALPLRERDDD